MRQCAACSLVVAAVGFLHWDTVQWALSLGVIGFASPQGDPGVESCF